MTDNVPVFLVSTGLFVIAAAIHSLDFWQGATFAALLAAVLGLWFAPRFWWCGLIVATLCGYRADVLQGLAVIWIALAWLVCTWHADAPLTFGMRRVATTASVLVFTLLLGTHALPGFHNPLVIDRLRFTPDAEPYSLYLNFDKTLAGLLLLRVCYREWSGLTGLRRHMSGASALIAVNVAVLIAASYLLGYVIFEPKWTTLFWLWAVVNLFSTCLSEEAFFRGFVQRELQLQLQHVRYGHWIALAISAVLFGLAHIAGGWRYVLLSTLAGVGYGVVYRRTQRIECAMVAHFALNATHFLLFTYPRLG
jgi:uncharacterized protein